MLFGKTFTLQSILPKTLKTKLSIALFSIGFFPYLLILIYSHNLGEQKIIEDVLKTHSIQMSQAKKSIEEQFISLQKEMRFLASLDIMNDMIVGDIDKRIANLLIQKERDLALDLALFTLNMSGEVISSSDHQKYKFLYHSKFREALSHQKGYFFTPKSVVFFTPIDSTLEKNQQLGYLFVSYSLSNLKSFTLQEEGMHSIIYHRSSQVEIGEKHDGVRLDIHPAASDYIDDRYLVLYQQFDGILTEWSLVYMIHKSVALAFLDSFILFVWGLFGLGFVVIALISLWISRRILYPISKLSQATQSIISTKDYTTQVSVDSQGEISRLADDFNAMIRETNSAFEVLEKENKLRLLRFIQLINIFNQLIETQSEEACISIALDELKHLMPHQKFSFSREYPTQKQSRERLNYLMLYIKDFERQTCDFYGVIHLEYNQELKDPHEYKFYRSIATMIMLQLDQIRLIEQTQEASRAKSNFISHMSHELRTPLHTILSSTQYLISYEKLTEQQQEKIATVESSADYLLGMINDILDLAQIEAGKITATIIKQSSDEVAEIVEEIISMLEVLAQQKDIVITFDNRVTATVYVYLDIRLFKQIIINILSNAIKFTPKGSIEFVLVQSSGGLELTIQDSGIGISPQNLSKLFSEFSQIKEKKQTQEKGSGLGLAISKKLSRLFDADIILESDGEGLGTRAIVYLTRIMH